MLGHLHVQHHVSSLLFLLVYGTCALWPLAHGLECAFGGGFLGWLTAAPLRGCKPLQLVPSFAFVGPAIHPQVGRQVFGQPNLGPPLAVRAQASWRSKLDKIWSTSTSFKTVQYSGCLRAVARLRKNEGGQIQGPPCSDRDQAITLAAKTSDLATLQGTLSQLARVPTSIREGREKRKLEGKVMKQFASLPLKGHDIVKKLTPELKAYYHDNKGAQNAVKALRSKLIIDDSSGISPELFLHQSALDSGYASSTRDRTGFLLFVATMETIGEYLQSRSPASPVHKLVADAEISDCRGGRAGMLRALRSVNQRYINTQRKEASKVVAALTKIPVTDKEWKVRKALEGEIIHNVDALRAAHPSRKEIKKTVGRHVRAQFGSGTRVECTGSVIKRTDVPGSDVDFWIYGSSPVSRSDMNALKQRLRTDNFLENVIMVLGQKALKLTVPLRTAVDIYDVVPSNPSYFEYRREDFPQSRGANDRLVADAMQRDYFHDNQPAQRATRMVKKIVDEVGEAAWGLRGFTAEALVQLVAQAEGLAPAVRDRTGALTLRAGIKNMKITRDSSQQLPRLQ